MIAKYTRRTIRVVVFALLAAGTQAFCAEVVSRAFELRYLSRDPKANGETDFKGPTAVFDTEQRMEYLRHYADYAVRFFNDPRLDSKVVNGDEVSGTLRGIKPQPLPTARKRIPLTDWRYLGYRNGQREAEAAELERWKGIGGIRIENGALVVTGETARFTKAIAEQKWRMGFSWKAKSPVRDRRSTFALSDAVVVGFNKDGEFFYATDGREVAAGEFQTNCSYNFKVEVDLDAKSMRYNFSVDDRLKADFVPVAMKDKTIVVKEFIVEGVKGLVLDDLWGVGYSLDAKNSSGAYKSDTLAAKETRVSRDPYAIETFIDETFEVRPLPDGFQAFSYDDIAWSPVPRWPYAHGGERYRDETLYLRAKVKIEGFERAVLNIETVRPAAEVYVNGTLVKKVGQHPEHIDVTEFFRPNQENAIACKVAPCTVRGQMGHMNTDRHTGWFVGQMELDLTGRAFVKDVFAYAASIGNPAANHVEMELTAEKRDFDGFAVVEYYPWFPEEVAKPAVTDRFPIRIGANATIAVKRNVTISNPCLWTVESPRLYKVRVVLEDDAGKPVDDFVFTTGLRTISQDGGTFRVNGKPEMLLGPLIFQYFHPLDKVSQWMYCPPMECLINEMLMVKKLTGNTMRMSVHDTHRGGVNDRRLVEIGDQMGMMFLWQTPAWIRTDGVADYDFEGLVKYMCEVRNHPSIVMWQPANHPHIDMKWFERLYQTVSPTDSSRLIAPTAELGRLKGKPRDTDSTYPSWIAPMVARGAMEQTTGYAKDWSELRELPEGGKLGGGLRAEYLGSKTHAFFDFEDEESIGQPNWNLIKGKPSYKIYSYENFHDAGAIGRLLTFDEWRESQAYQAFSAYEAYRKKRWLDFDGLNWCCLRGGPNTATYMKPIADYYDHAKLPFHAVKMAFQRVLAGSKNVDVVYGPEDFVPLVVLNLGDAKSVDVAVRATTTDGKLLAEVIHRDVQLAAGRAVKDLPLWKPGLAHEGFCVFEYCVRALAHAHKDNAGVKEEPK